MGFKTFCPRDPLLEFIHETFGATVVRVPDPRWRPLALFRSDRKKVRYLGLADDLDQRTPTAPPRSESVSMPTIDFHQSSFVQWHVAADLLGPILQHLLGVSVGAVTASLGGARGRETKVSISLARTRRTFVPPVGIARWIEVARPALPASMRADMPDGSVFVVDSVLLARKLNVLVEGESSAEVTANLALAVGPNLGANNVVTTDTRVSIDMPQVAPFAFTAIEVGFDSRGFLSDVRTEHGLIRAAAAPVELLAPVNRPPVSAANELVTFDD